MHKCCQNFCKQLAYRNFKIQGLLLEKCNSLTGKFTQLPLPLAGRFKNGSCKAAFDQRKDIFIVE